VFQRGENVFRSLMCCLQIERIGTEVNLVIPDQLTRLPNAHLLENGVVSPSPEHSLTRQMGKVNDTAPAVVERQFQTVIFQHLDARHFVHGFSIPDSAENRKADADRVIAQRANITTRKPTPLKA